MVFSDEMRDSAYYHYSPSYKYSLGIELVDEKGDDAVKVVSAYLQFLEKDMQASDVWSVLEGVRDSNGRMAGVGIGSLRNSVERRSGEITSNVH